MILMLKDKGQKVVKDLFLIRIKAKYSEFIKPLNAPKALKKDHLIIHVFFYS